MPLCGFVENRSAPRAPSRRAHRQGRGSQRSGERLVLTGLLGGEAKPHFFHMRADPLPLAGSLVFTHV